MEQLNSSAEQSLSGYHFNSVIDWKELPIAEQEFVKDAIRVLKFKKKAVIYSMRENPRGVYIIRKGKIKIEQVSYDGSVQILFVYAESEAFGFRPLLSNELHPVNAVALEDCELEFIAADSFLQLLRTSVTLSNLLLQSLSHEFTVLVNRINLFAQRGIKERLAFALLVLNEKYRQPADTDVAPEIKISRTDLANYAGTSLENLVRTLKFFKERKLVSVSGKSIFLLNPDALLLLSGIQ